MYSESVVGDHITTSATTSISAGLFSSISSMTVIKELWGKSLIVCALLFMFRTFLFGLLCLFYISFLFFHFCFGDTMTQHVSNPATTRNTNYIVFTPMHTGSMLHFSPKTKKDYINIFRWKSYYFYYHQFYYLFNLIIVYILLIILLKMYLKDIFKMNLFLLSKVVQKVTIKIKMTSVNAVYVSVSLRLVRVAWNF